MLGDILVFALIWTAIYTLIALGFSMVFGVARILNLAHGAFFMVASYLVYFFVSRWGLGLLPAALAAILFTALLAVVFYRLLIRPCRDSLTRVLMVTLGLSMFLQQVMVLLFGPDAKYVPSAMEGGTFILGVRVTNQQILTVAVAAVLIALVALFLAKTNLGRIIRAVAQDRDMASMMGINSEYIFYFVMAFSAALAAAAGILVAPFLTVTPSMGQTPILVAFTIVVLGGLGNIPGTLIGAFIVAVIEMSTSYAISPQLKEAFTFLVMVLALILRPQGILGKGEA